MFRAHCRLPLKITARVLGMLCMLSVLCVDSAARAVRAVLGLLYTRVCCFCYCTCNIFVCIRLCDMSESTHGL